MLRVFIVFTIVIILIFGGEYPPTTHSDQNVKGFRDFVPKHWFCDVLRVFLVNFGSGIGTGGLSEKN